jgi:nitric oxide reductase NorE protein
VINGERQSTAWPWAHLAYVMCRGRKGLGSYCSGTWRSSPSCLPATPNARGQGSELFAESQNSLNRNFGAVNTLVLLTSSLLVLLAGKALRSDRWRHLAPRLTLSGAAVGACFVVIKVFEYHERVAGGDTPSTNEFFMYYFVLTGLHLVHVLAGLAILLALSRLIRRPELTTTHIAFFEGGSCFWHLVDLLWIVIFPLLFLVRRS